MNGAAYAASRAFDAPRSDLRVSPHIWGLLPGAPTPTGVGLAPTEKAQRVTFASAKIAASATITSRRTMTPNHTENLFLTPSRRGRYSRGIWALLLP